MVQCLVQLGVPLGWGMGMMSRLCGLSVLCQGGQQPVHSRSAMPEAVPLGLCSGRWTHLPVMTSTLVSALC